MDILGYLRGNKTFMIVLGLLGYIGVNMANGVESDPNVVNALLAGSVWTLRLGVSNGGKAKK